MRDVQILWMWQVAPQIVLCIGGSPHIWEITDIYMAAGCKHPCILASLLGPGKVQASWALASLAEAAFPA